MLRASLAALVFVCAAPCFGNDGSSPTTVPRAAACESTQELAAAKSLLEAGDRAGALIHLRRARELAAACEAQRRSPRFEDPFDEAAAEWAIAALRGAVVPLA